MMDITRLAHDISIRLVQPGDELLMYRFFMQLSEETKAVFSGSSFTREHAEQLIREAQQVHTIRRFTVIKHGAHSSPDQPNGDAMLGMLWLWKWELKVVWLGLMIADPYQGQGYGNVLIQFAKQYAGDFGKGGILLTTHNQNIRGQRLYQKNEFQTIGEDSRGEYVMMYSFADVPLER
jgi:GNAT superfamily N-acetyltransferase